MNKILTILVVLCATTSLVAQSDQQIENLKAFAKAYGYVKYFHPSDEAQQINWDKLAIYGAQQVEKCATRQELVDALNALFTPIAPTVTFSKSQPAGDLDLTVITPPDPSGYEPTYWQHLGVSTGMSSRSARNKTYQSTRVNRFPEIEQKISTASILNIMTIASKFQNKEIKYKVWVKMNEGTGTGNLSLRFDHNNGTTESLYNLNDQAITSGKWQQYELTGKTSANTKSILLGATLNGDNTMYIDDISLAYKNGKKWVEIPLKNRGFESEGVDGALLDYGRWYASAGNNYRVQRTQQAAHKGKWSGAIISVDQSTVAKHAKIFDAAPTAGEAITKELSDGVFCQIPLVLYGNVLQTFPKAEETRLQALISHLKDIDTSPENLSARLGNVINAYNVFQHFYPYFEVVAANWEEELEKALISSYKDQNNLAHLQTLERLTAALRDGHVRVSGHAINLYMNAPITWEWVEGQLVITNVVEGAADVKVGDIVTKVNGLSAKEYFEGIYETISAASEGWLHYMANRKSLQGPMNQLVKIEVAGKEVALEYNRSFYKDISPLLSRKTNAAQIDGDIYYLDLDALSMEDINELMPKLQESQSIICDLRGYPKGNHDLIRHIMPVDDSTAFWMRIPQIIYPDYQRIAGYKTFGWDLTRLKPDLSKKHIVFITDGSAISYAESYMGYIKSYQLATIVGQPTAGTNGNVNSFTLPGGYGISWTGMEVRQHDRSVFHGVGIVPDVYVTKTIAGVREGKDEFLEKAIEVARNKMK